MAGQPDDVFKVASKEVGDKLVATGDWEYYGTDEEGNLFYKQTMAKTLGADSEVAGAAASADAGFAHLASEKPGQAAIPGFLEQLQALASKGSQDQRVASAVAQASEEGLARQSITEATRRGLGGSGAQLAGMRAAGRETGRARMEARTETQTAIQKEITDITIAAAQLMTAEMEYYRLSMEEMAQHINTLSLWMDLLTNNDLIKNDMDAAAVGTQVGQVLQICMALGTQEERTACVNSKFGGVGTGFSSAT